MLAAIGAAAEGAGGLGGGVEFGRILALHEVHFRHQNHTPVLGPITTRLYSAQFAAPQRPGDRPRAVQGQHTPASGRYKSQRGWGFSIFPFLFSISPVQHSPA
jgi:hypothetical protein